MDKSAVGHDYVAKVEKHGSQTDAAKGFGGKFGVQTDRVDKVRLLQQNNHHPQIKLFLFFFKSAVGWDYQEKLGKHESQTDGSIGFGGKFGVQTDRIDKVFVYFHNLKKTKMLSCCVPRVQSVGIIKKKWRSTKVKSMGKRVLEENLVFKLIELTK